MNIVFDSFFVNIPNNYKNENGDQVSYKDLKICFLENVENVRYFLILNRFSNICQMILSINILQINIFHFLITSTTICF